MFEEERSSLQPVPEAEFEYFKIGMRTVHADGHSEVSRAYYSVPSVYLGKRVTVHFNAKWVKVFAHEKQVLKLIAFHRTIVPGRFRTERQHLPDKKSFTVVSYTRYLIG